MTPLEGDVMPPAPSKRRRLYVRGCGCLALLGVALLVFLGVALYLLPRSTKAKNLALEKVRDLVEKTTGGALEVGSLELTVSPLVLTARDVTWGVRGQEPVVKAGEVRAALDLGFSQELEVLDLALSRIVVNLAAPRPIPPASDSPTRLASPVTIRRFSVKDVVVLGFETPPDLARYLKVLQISIPALAGSASPAGITLEPFRGELLVDRVGRAIETYAFAGAATAPPEGPVSLTGLSFTAPGLELSGSASLGLEGKDPLSAELALKAALAEAVPEISAGGNVSAAISISGSRDEPHVKGALKGTGITMRGVAVPELRLDVDGDRGGVDVSALTALFAGGGSLTGKGRLGFAPESSALRLELDRVPLGLVAPFVDKPLARDLALEASALSGTLALWAENPASLRASFHLMLLRGSEVIAQVTGGAEGPLRERGTADAFFEADFLPALEGRRTLSGKLRAPSLATLADGAFTSARLRVDTPALRDDLAALRRLYPAFVPQSVLDAPSAALTLDASATGTLRAPRVELAGALRQAGGGLLRLAAKGRPRPLSGDARIDVEGLDLASFSAFTVPGLEGRVTGSIEVAGDRRAFTAALRLEGQDLEAEKIRIGTARLALDADADARFVRITRLTGEGLGRTFQAQGQGSRTAPWNAASLALSIQGLDQLLPAVDARVALRNGILGLEIADLCALGAVGRLDATLPLGTLKKAPDLASSLSFLPTGLPEGPGLVRLEASTLDTAVLLAALGQPARAERATFGLSLALEPDIANPWNSKGLARLTDLTIETKEATLHADAPVQLGYAGRVASVSSLRLVSEGLELALTAQAALDPKTKGHVRYLTVNADGRTDASLLAPFLEGAVARGPLTLEAHVAGPPDRLFGRVALSGKTASFTWPSPYLTALQSPDLLLEVRDGAFTIRSGTALLNGGPVTFEGGFRDGDLDATARFTNVRYLLTYGLRASFDGSLRLQVPKEGLPLLSGSVALKRGLLDRDVDLDREILTRFFTPELAAAGGVGFLDTLGLDIDVTTDSGVKVVNNLADLRVDWGALEIRGTAREPVIRGRLTVDPGGTLSAYGQRFTLGKTVITYAGDPSSDPKIDSTLTASTQDGAAGLPASFAAPGSEPQLDGAAGTGLTAIAAGVAGYYGEQFASKLGQSLGFTRVTLRPVLVYGEADPGARLTLSRDFSRNVAFTFSLDLTNAQSQTYLLDLHGLKGLPSLTFQVFTNDADSWGGVVQQSLQLGGGRRRDTSLPVLHDVVFTGVDGRGVPRSKLKRAVKLRKGESVPETAAFDTEVDLERVLRDAGFPDADVATSFPKSARREGRVDLAIAVVPGPKTAFVFEGDRPPANARRAITELYRGDFFEPATVEEMRRTTERAFRTLGHLAPAVTVLVSANGAERVVTVTTDAGPKTPLPPPVFTGVSEGEAAALGQRFLAPADRAELALGTPDAERRLLAALRALGYPFAAIASRESGPDGVVTVALATGGVTRVDSLEVTGVPPEEAARLLALVALKPGAPARSRDVAAGTLAIQDDLLARGFPEARVRSTLSPASPEIPPPLAIRYEVTAGPAQQLAGVRFEGLKSSSRSFLERVAGMSLGSPYRQEDVDTARSRLFGTGIFTKVTGERRDVPESPGRTEAVFTVEEKPRFTVAYGVRAESGAGAGFVLDLVDTNAFGRAITVGLRGLYEPKDRGGRFFVGSDDILGSKITAQAFLEMRRVLEGGEENDDFVKSTTEASLQVSRFFGPRVNVKLYGKYRFTSLKERVPDPFFPGLFDIEITYPYAGTQIVYDSRKDALLGSKGLFASLDLSATGSFLGSDFRYTRAFGQVNSYVPIFETSRFPLLWAQSVRAGLARSPAGESLLPDARFFAGGEFSVRGYERDTLGPTEELGDLTSYVGGRNLLVLNEELRFPLFWRLTGVAFFDAASVFDSSKDFSTYLSKSLGLGLRAITPVGVFRLDAARPLDRKESEKAYRLYFGFGNTF